MPIGQSDLGNPSTEMPFLDDSRLAVFKLWAATIGKHVFPRVLGTLHRQPYSCGYFLTVVTLLLCGVLVPKTTANMVSDGRDPQVEDCCARLG